MTFKFDFYFQIDTITQANAFIRDLIQNFTGFENLSGVKIPLTPLDGTALTYEI